jgi:hypothetical protein
MAVSNASSSTINKNLLKSRKVSSGMPPFFDILLIGAGGSGGTNGGGGGAGGHILHTNVVLQKGYTYMVGIGLGGLGGAYWQESQNGGYSIVTGPGLSLTPAYGGGGGGNEYLRFANGKSGSSGGGGGYALDGSVATARGGQAIFDQGFSGGRTTEGSAGRYGGGGGAGAVGENGVSGTRGGNGGNGTDAYSIWGAATSSGQNISGTYWFCGGGGGGSQSSGSGGSGGNGGGGAGSVNTTATNATANTGGGGGGCSGGGGTSGNGSDGLVIIRYNDSYPNASITGVGTLYTSGGYKYYKFTSNGTISF